MSRRSRQSSTVLPRHAVLDGKDDDVSRRHSFDDHNTGADSEELSADLQYLQGMLADQFPNSAALGTAFRRLQHDDVATAEIIHEMCPEDFSRLGISCGHRIAIVKAAREICGLGNSIGGASVSPTTGGVVSSNPLHRGNQQQLARAPKGPGSTPTTLSRNGSVKGKTAQDILFGQKPFTGKKVCAALSASSSSGGQLDGVSPQLKNSGGDDIGDSGDDDLAFAVSDLTAAPHEDPVGRQLVLSPQNDPHDREGTFDTLGSSFASLMEYVETSHAMTKERYSTSARCEGGNPAAPPLSSLHISTRSNPHDRNKMSSHVRWEEMSGYCSTLKEFLLAMRDAREQAGFPSLFDRLFYDNKPMPFVELSHSHDMAALLLRIPDLTDEEGTSITTITNRVCFMINFADCVVMTYHACENDPLKSFQREWEGGQHERAKIEKVVRTMIRRVLYTYTEGLAALQSKLDDLENQGSGGDETVKVQTLSTLQKKAAVYRRCAAASQEALLELQGVPSMKVFVGPLVDSLDIVISVAEEIGANALSSIDLTIALSEFKSNANLKIFTYITILLQPVTLATSWYGMNFVNMPELMDENAYFEFIPIVWGLALVIFSLFLFREFGASLLGPIPTALRSLLGKIVVFTSRHAPHHSVPPTEVVDDTQTDNVEKESRRRLWRRATNVIGAATKLQRIPSNAQKS